MDDHDVKELEFVIRKLKEDFDQSELTIVDMHNKSPDELLRLVNDVIFADLEPNMVKNWSRPREECLQSMLEFALGRLGYKESEDVENLGVGVFSDEFIKGNQEVIYPFMYWILSQKEILKKRAYLARFLTTLPIPEDMFADNVVVTLFQDHKDLQNQFKEVHAEVEEVRATANNPISVQDEISQLEEEAEMLTSRLNNKLAQLQQNSSDDNKEMKDMKEMKEVTQLLRKKQEEAAKIEDNMLVEKAKQKAAEQAYKQIQAKYSQMVKSDYTKKNPRDLYKKLTEDVKALELNLNEKMPADYHQLEKMYQELRKVMSTDPLTNQQVKSLTNEVKELGKSVQELTTSRDNLLSSADGQINFYRDRASAMERKKEQLTDKLSELEDDQKDAQNDLRQLKADLQALSIGGQMPKTDSQMKAYMVELTKKTAEYKQKKSDLQLTRDEVTVLVRTEEVLRSRDDNISEFNEQLAAEKGVSGFQETQDSLEAVASTKAAIDMSKGDALDQMSQTVQQIVQTLKAKKNKLAPIIKELRSVRHSFEEEEEKYTKQKSMYDNTCLGLESERLKLEQDVEANVTGILEEESAYHFLNCLSQITQVNLDLMAMETKYQFGNSEERLNETHKSYREMYEKTISGEEEMAKKLRTEKVQIKEQHGDNVQQRSLFLNLRKIMQCKAAMQKKQVSQAHDEENRLVFGDGGGERMVIE